jgi:hypothetical protein
MAQARWEMENQVQVQPAQGEDVDALYRYDHAEQQVVQTQKPWSKDPHFFKQWVDHGGPASARRRCGAQRDACAHLTHDLT